MAIQILLRLSSEASITRKKRTHKPESNNKNNKSDLVAGESEMSASNTGKVLKETKANRISIFPVEEKNIPQKNPKSTLNTLKICMPKY